MKFTYKIIIVEVVIFNKINRDGLIIQTVPALILLKGILSRFKSFRRILLLICLIPVEKPLNSNSANLLNAA